MVIPLVTPSCFLFSDFLQQFTVNSNPHPAGSRRRFLLPEDISQVVQKSGGGEEQRSGRPIIHVVEKILGILIALSCCQRQPAASGIPILRHLLAKQIELAQCVLSELVSLLGRCHQPLERLLHILGEQLSLKKELTQPVLGKLIVQFCAPAQPPQSLTEILRYFTSVQKQLGQCVHGQIIAGEGFRPKESESLPLILRMAIAPIEKLTGFFVPLAPCRGGWSFGGLSIAFTEQLREILRGNGVLIGQKILD